jgi:hypothetical protein
MSRNNRLALLLALLAGGIVLTAAYGLLRLTQYPDRQAARLRQQLAATADLPVKERALLEIQLLQYETDNRIKIWTAVVQAAGGAALLVGLFFTARNLQATQDKLDIDRQGQLTNRFILAAGQLGADFKDGAPNVAVRLGGIYALNRISRDWPKDYWPIAEVLTAYVRHNARWDPTAAAVAGRDRKPTSRPSSRFLAVTILLKRSANVISSTFAIRTSEAPNSGMPVSNGPTSGALTWRARSSGARVCVMPSSTTRIWPPPICGARTWNRPRSMAPI